MGQLRPRRWTVLVGVGALLGLLFASVSTYDFVMHLDRQVHDVHCSFVPGLAGPEVGQSGCQVTLVSSYSSVLRTTVWGGIPISLPAMAVFAFLLAFAVELTVTDRQEDVRATGFLALATGLPALSSLVMAYLSLVELDAVCKLCIGIYVASALSLAGGIGLFLRARKGETAAPAARPGKPRPRPPTRPDEPAWVGPQGEAPPPTEPEPEPAPEPPRRRPAAVSWGYLGGAFAIGLLFVAVPLTGYVAAAPDHERFIGTCGALVEAPDKELLVPLDPRPGEPPVIEVLDPLCPACLGFEERVEASGLSGEMDRHAVLFPIDNSCNWMVSQALHPGACAVSRAMLCAGAGAPGVLDWAFTNQEAIRTAAAEDPEAAARMAASAFPALRDCIDAPETKAKLNRSLRWAVVNQLPVLTPQLYVGEVKLCEEDVDIGLDFTLSRMLAAHEEGTLRAAEQPEPPADPLADEPAAPKADRPASEGADEAGKPASEEPDAAPSEEPDEEGEPASEEPASEGADEAAKPASDEADESASEEPDEADEPATDEANEPASDDSDEADEPATDEADVGEEEP